LVYSGFSLDRILVLFSIQVRQDSGLFSVQVRHDSGLFRVQFRHDSVFFFQGSV